MRAAHPEPDANPEEHRAGLDHRNPPLCGRGEGGAPQDSTRAGFSVVLVHLHEERDGRVHTYQFETLSGPRA